MNGVTPRRHLTTQSESKMSKAKVVKLKGKQLAKRLTGISTPIGGISWTPPIDEREVAKQLLVHLEDRRALYMPYDMEVGPYVDGFNY